MKSSTQNLKQNRKPKPSPKAQKRAGGEVKAPESFKIQKILANAGVASRRAVEQMITDGKVKVNNKIAKLGDRMSLKDRVWVNGEAIDLGANKIETEFLMYHKPVGEICSTNVETGTGSVFDNLPEPTSGRWVMIGRLDVSTSGLLMFTNSGDEAHKYMHPKFQIEREYQVRVLGELTPDTLDKLKKGVMLEDGLAKFDKITPVLGRGGANNWYQVMLKEGRNREVRRLFESQGLTVSRLIRTRFGRYQLPRGFPPGSTKVVSAVSAK